MHSMTAKIGFCRISAYVLQILLVFSLALQAQECEQFDVGLFPDYVRQGKGVVLVKTLTKVSSGFVIANPFNFADNCDDSPASLFIMTAAHIIDNDGNLFISEEEKSWFQRSALFELNYEKNQIPIRVLECKIVYCPFMAECFEPIAGTSARYGEDLAILKIELSRTELDQVSPWYFGFDFMPDPNAKHILWVWKRKSIFQRIPVLIPDTARDGEWIIE